MKKLFLSATLMGIASLAYPHGNTPGAVAPDDAASVTKAVRTGSGIETYVSVPNWCEMPPGQSQIGNTHGAIVIDKTGLIYINSDTKRSIMVYSPEGKFLRSFGEDYVQIHGMCIREENGEEFIYAAHLGGGEAVKFKLDGTVVWTIPWPQESGMYKSKSEFKPTAIAVGPNGDIYVSDGYGKSLIHQYSKDLKYIRTFGGKGTEPGKFQTSHGMALDTRGPKPLLMICDRENRRIQYFDLDGNFVKVAVDGLRRPCSVSFHGDKVAVAELEGRVTILDKDNHPIAFLGDNPIKAQWAVNPVPPADWREGIFTAPHGICYDTKGNLYVMDWNKSGRISRLNRMYPE
ncbi:6-bladed beta-propeller [bacterium]|nr:6-bladed beta-propeller [bacterium]